MAFPTTAVLDNFNRADTGPPPSASWSTPTGAGGCAVSGNYCYCDSSPAWSIYNVSTYGANSEAYGTLVNDPDSNTHGVLARMVQTGDVTTIDGYSVRVVESFGVKVNIYRVDNGAATQLGSSKSVALVASSKFGIEIIGSGISSYTKIGAGSWTKQDTQTDATYSAVGNVGIYLTSFTALDDFGGGTVVSAVDPFPALPRQEFVNTLLRM
jgi:hypothetical protein